MRRVAIGNKRELDQFEFVEPIPEFPIVIDAMSIKLHSRPTYGHDDKQVAAFFQDPLQFARRFPIAHRIKWIPISPKADVLDDVHARQ